MNVKQAIITGATGPLGVALIKHLTQQGIKVAAVVNPKSSRIAELTKLGGLHIVKCDLAELPRLASQLKPTYDAFFHLGWSATDSRKTRNDPIIHTQNILYTLDAVRLAHNLRCSIFIGAGSQAEHPPNESGQNEESYGIAKYAAGKLSLKLCEQLGLQHCWARIQSIYGPAERETTALMYCIHTLLKGKKPSLTKGEQSWDYLYSTDCARALYLMAEKGQHGTTYSVGSGTTKPLYEYFECLRDCIDPSLPLGLGDKEYSHGQAMHLQADIRELTNDTGFVPEYSFEEGIRKTIAWVRNNC